MTDILPLGLPPILRRRNKRSSPEWSPQQTTSCVDCDVGTITIGEWYMVCDDIWEQAWRGRRKSWHALPGQEVLCIGCLEKWLGHTLMASDFLPVPCNDPNQRRISKRLRDRLVAADSTPLRRKRGRPQGSKNKLKHRDERAECERVE